MKLSLIIPAYNAGKYLERCIDSTVEQDLSPDDYEVIVIDDGSTDNTLQMIGLLGEKYKFIRYISISNGGVSMARNIGLEMARGEYILFIDADDSIIPNCLKTIYQEVKNNRLDMMLMNYCCVFSDGKHAKSGFHIDQNTEKICSGREFLLTAKHPPMLPLYVYRRLFLLENNLTLLLIRHEDEEFIPRAILLADRIKYYPLIFYNYFQNSGSFMNNYKESNFYDMISAMASLKHFGESFQGDARVLAYFNDLIANRLLMIFKRSIRDGYFIQKSLVENMKKNALFPLKPRIHSFYSLFFNYFPSLFERYYRFRKRKMQQ